MQYRESLIAGKLLRRYKRFLADVRLETGEYITAHCPNSGSLKSCNIPGNNVQLSYHDQPTRKYPYTWEMIEVDGIWVGINTGHPNRLVAEAVQDGTITELQGYPVMRKEVKYGKNSRIDLLLENQSQICYVEVKNVTLVEKGRARFPDAVTERGQKHLKELMGVIRKGHRAVNLFVIQREDAFKFSPSDDIDPEYGRLLREAAKKGVEILVYLARVTPANISIITSLPLSI